MSTKEEKYIYWYIIADSTTGSKEIQYQMKTSFFCKFADVLSQIDKLIPKISPAPRYLFHVRKGELDSIICDDDSLFMSLENMAEHAFNSKKGMVVRIPKEKEVKEKEVKENERVFNFKKYPGAKERNKDYKDFLY